LLRGANLPAGRQGQKFNFAPKIGWRARVAGEPATGLRYVEVRPQQIHR